MTEKPQQGSKLNLMCFPTFQISFKTYIIDPLPFLASSYNNSARGGLSSLQLKVMCRSAALTGPAYLIADTQDEGWGGGGVAAFLKAEIEEVG